MASSTRGRTTEEQKEHATNLDIKTMEVTVEADRLSNSSTKDDDSVSSPSSRASSAGRSGPKPEGSDRASARVSPALSISSALGSAGLTVKNTFLHLKDDAPEDDDSLPPLRRSASEGALMPTPLELTIFEPLSSSPPLSSRVFSKNNSTLTGSQPSPRDDAAQVVEDGDEEEEEEDGLEERQDDAIGMTRKVPQEVMNLAHNMGQCNPCIYFAFKEDKCRNDGTCLFCHFCTKKEILARRKRMKALRKAATDANPQGAQRQGKANPPMKPGELPRSVGLQNPIGLTTNTSPLLALG